MGHNSWCPTNVWLFLGPIRSLYLLGPFGEVKRICGIDEGTLEVLNVRGTTTLVKGLNMLVQQPVAWFYLAFQRLTHDAVP